MGKLVWLCNTRSEAEAGMVAGILENEGIPVQVSSRGAGQVYSLSALFGTEILVPEEAHARARELLDAYFQENAVLLETELAQEGEE